MDISKEQSEQAFKEFESSKDFYRSKNKFYTRGKVPKAIDVFNAYVEQEELKL
jgi:hypothetical protein